MRKKIYSKYLSNNSEIKFKQLLTIFSKNPIYPKFYTIFVVNDKDAFLLSVEHTLKFLFNMNDSIEQLKIWIFRHKYLFVTIAFLIIIVFLDENNMMKHIQNRREIMSLESQKSDLLEEYDVLSRKLDELNADPVYMEKIARDRYKMHKEGEEIFIFDD